MNAPDPSTSLNPSPGYTPTTPRYPPTSPMHRLNLPTIPFLNPRASYTPTTSPTSLNRSDLPTMPSLNPSPRYSPTIPRYSPTSPRYRSDLPTIPSLNSILRETPTIPSHRSGALTLPSLNPSLRYHPTTPSYDPVGPRHRRALSSLAYSPNPPLPTKDKYISDLKPLLESFTCSLCLEAYSEEHFPVRLPKCGHVYGDYCIVEWFESNHENANTCPLCRGLLFESEFVDEDEHSGIIIPPADEDHALVEEGSYANLGRDDNHAIHEQEVEPELEHEVEDDATNRQQDEDHTIIAEDEENANDLLLRPSGNLSPDPLEQLRLNLWQTAEFQDSHEAQSEAADTDANNEWLDTSERQENRAREGQRAWDRACTRYLETRRTVPSDLMGPRLRAIVMPSDEEQRQRLQQDEDEGHYSPFPHDDCDCYGCWQRSRDIEDEETRHRATLQEYEEYEEEEEEQEQDEDEEEDDEEEEEGEENLSDDEFMADTPYPYDLDNDYDPDEDMPDYS
ncbi:hypothetical protein K505DRAFT_381009 [Melanomma pulvis-pyrius CBS 109.77]|uniref:RING-type domain-containing protein n=1 Tax=Melanomma pulvis-pyrius CBS 109.77 TaxID=1314802 RepID=A0A6A6XY78_9PLEO|nr:hypothetical protein K505DRAFT_381009 [Melanomma pulvis-pyrius CBS 109.77]